MTVNRTTLLDLPLPVTGTESGTWGDTTNNGLTQYMDIAIAGMSNLTSANFTTGALTIETTEGNSSATNISATSAQYAGFRVTSLAQNSTITVGNTGTNPARSYRLINADATYTLTFKATGQTGITLQPGQTAVVAFNGTDYVIVGMAGAGTVTDNAIVRFDGTTGKLVQNSVVTIADSTGDIAGAGSITSTSASGILTRAAATQDGVELIGRAGGSSSYKVTLTPTTLGGNRTLTLPDTTGTVALTGSTVASFSAGSTGFTPNSATTGAVTLAGTLATTNGGTGLTSFTANGVVYASSSSALATGSALTFDGNNMTQSGPNAAVTLQVNTANAGVSASNYSEIALSDVGNVRTYWRSLRDGSGATIFSGNDHIRYALLGTEQMRLTSTGLGIGTSSPAYKLDVLGAGRVSTAVNSNATTLILNNTNTAGGGVGVSIDGYSGGTTNKLAQIVFGGAGATGGNIDFQPSADGSAYSFAMRLDSSGNLGLGVTPSFSWTNTVSAAFQVKNVSFAGIDTNDLHASSNAYYVQSAAQWRYLATGVAATNYYQNAGAHVWRTAASGTAGNAISWTQAMTLDASGNLLVGTTSSIDNNIKVQLATDGTNTQRFFGVNNNTGYGILFGFVNNTEGNVRTVGAYPLTFGTNNTERARITSGGNLLVGETSDYLSTRLLVDSASTDNSTNALTLRNSGNTELFRVRSDGYIYAGFYAQTTANAANVNIAAGGDLLRSTSALKYKQDIRDLESIDITKFRPVRYKSKCLGDDQTKDHFGIIADEVAAAGIEELVTRGADGEVEGFQYERLTVVLLKELQSLRARVAQLEGA